MVTDLINKQIITLANNFEKISNYLLPKTKNLSIAEFENGTYGFLYVKPNKRLAKIFSSDREVLVFITTFRDQQQRTILALKNEIDASTGRLEGTLAIIVHSDPDGDRKLKNWGREQGVSILPIYSKEMLESEYSIERNLLQDFFANDPFDVTGPVSDDGRFFGRRSEAIDIARQLSNGQIKSSLGIRKIGKTSILNRILHEVTNSHKCICLMIDCSKDDVWEQSAAELMYSISETLGVINADGLNYSEIKKFNRKNINISDARNSLLLKLIESEIPVIIFFDEVDYITPGSPTAKKIWMDDFNKFWRNLRVVFQEAFRQNKKFSIFVSGVSSKWFKEESINEVENAALAFLPEEYLSPLAPNAIVAMIRSTSKVAGLSFDDETADWIGEACGNMPYWTRKACSYIHRNLDIKDRPNNISIEVVKDLVEKFIDVEGAAIAEVALNHLFKVYPEILEPSKDFLEGRKRPKSDALVSTLLRYGVLQEKNSQVVIGSSMIEHGLKLYLGKLANQEPLEIVATNENTQKDFLKYDIEEWAEELASINSSRNKLEKKLRQIVHIFKINQKVLCLKE